MKNLTKILAVSAIVLLSIFNNSSLKAQYQITNSGFETFENGFNGIGKQPTGWKGSNVTQTVAGTTVTKVLVEEATGRTGKCVYMHNEMVGKMGIEAPAPAYISLGTPWNVVTGMSTSSSMGGCEGGLNFTHRPDTMELWIKRTYSSQENAHAAIYLWKNNFSGTKYRNRDGASCLNNNRTNDEADVRGHNDCTTNSFGTLIGNGEWIKNEQYPNWTLIKVPLEYYNNEIPEKLNIIISAANYPYPAGQYATTVKAGSNLYADDLKLIYSSKIGRLLVNGKSVSANFHPDTLNYTYSVGTSGIPTVTAYRAGRQLGINSFANEITVVNGVVDDNTKPTKVTVRAADGSSTTTYNIYLVSQLSNDPRPLSISVNGAPISTFNRYVYSYNYALPYGTTACPTIGVETADGGQTYIISTCTSVPYTATVKTTAADGNSSVTYTINFTVAPFSDNTLQGIKIGGELLEDFKPTIYSYKVYLPSGTTVAPSIEPISAYAAGMQNIILTHNGLASPSTIMVTPNPSGTTRTYKITFEVTESSYAYLNDIKVGGQTLANFSPFETNYSYVLPHGTAVLPAITYTKGENSQTVTVTTNGVNGMTTITVTAENGNMVVYRINFSVFKSENSFLNDILINGQSIENFDPETFTYDIELPSGTTTMPNITWVAGDDEQNIKLYLGTLNGVTTIRVIAENTSFFTTYYLNISVALSANSQLEAILVDGEPLAGFSPEILPYNYILPEGTTQCPDIEVIKASLGQEVFIVKPALTGIATITVKPEAGEGKNVYTINFQFQMSNNNILDWIKLDGTPLAGFNSGTTSYTVNLPLGSTAPAVEYLANDPTSNVLVIDNGLNGVQITVTSQNGITRTYSINYNIPPTNNVNLADIEIWNNALQNFVSLADFDAQITDYEDSLVWRTNAVPAINPVAAENGQVITVFYSPVNDTTEIQVVAPNGIDQKTYKIYFPVKKSDYRFLSSIWIAGAEISEYPPYNNYFHPQIFSYNVTLPYGTTEIPQITFEKGKVGNQTIFEQNIEITAGTFTEPYKLKVIAEDGSTQTYTLNFSIDMSGNIGENYLDNIFAGNIPVENFDGEETFEYSVVLPYGTTELPELSFEKRYSAQTIATDLGGVWGTTKIKVFSNIAGIATTEYRINFSVSDVPTTTLNSISFDGNVFSNFDPKVHSYIVPVTSEPTYSYTHNQNAVFVDEIFKNHKKLVLDVTNKEDENDINTYTFWYYYTNDIIPNPSFENFQAMSSNSSGLRPTSWTCQGDVRQSVGAFNLQNQVQRSTDRTVGSYSVFIQGQYNGSTTGDENGLITLGGVTSTGSTLNAHSTTVTGGINFRNTPDQVQMDYKYDRNNNTQSPAMHFAFRLWNTGTNYSSGENVVNDTYSDGTIRTSWYTLTRGISYTGDNRYPQRMNIVLSCYKQGGTGNPENSYSYPTGGLGKLYVDNLRLGYNSTLSNVYVNGVAVAGFNGANNGSSYTVNIPAETMSPPKITFANAVPDQEVRITISSENASRQRNVTIISKAEDNTTTTQYLLVINRPAATVNTLAGISVGGTPIANFAPSTFTYNVTVPNGTIFSPDILVTKGEGHQNIAYSFTNGKVVITVTAENGTPQTYTVNFIEQTTDDNATLLNLEVVGFEINFDEETTEYNVVLPAGTQTIPQILFTKQSNGQTVILTTSSVNGTSVVKVIAQDNVTFNEYKINFSINAVATSHLLSGISLVNVPINGFAPTNFNYTVQIGNNTRFVFEKEFVADTMNVVYFDDSIKCYIGENIYKIVFEKESFHNAYLADIAVNGLSISTFEPTQSVYSTVVNGAILPDITVVSGAEGQTITFVWSETYVNISVVAADGITQNDYRVNFVSSNMSSNSLLQDILIDGISLEDFVSNEFEYTVELPDGTVHIPVIQAIKGDIYQTVVLTQSGLNTETTILVTAQDGTQSTYTIIFTVALSDYAFLNEILINGVLINGFAFDSLTYSYTLPYGTEDLPAVDYTKGHPNQTITVQSNGVNGDYIITVTSESGLFTNNYIISFETELSPNAYLENIAVNGVEIPNFIYDLFEYKIEVPCGTTEVPEVIWLVNNATVVPEYAETLSDTTKLTVTAENGINQNVYKIYFEIKPSSDVLLENIIIGGESLKEAANGYISDTTFVAEQFEYIITLPYGTTALPAGLPEISATGNGVAGCFTINIEQKNDSTVTIDVISGNGDVNTYTLSFEIGKSANSSLDGILINGEMLAGFHPDTVFYQIFYPIGTQESELINNINDITYILGDENQSVVVNIEDDNTIVVIVTAQDGVSVTVYIIEQIILKSDNALLADILIDGKSIADFKPTKFDYIYKLPFNASAIPAFVGVKQEESQTLEYDKRFAEEKSFIYVTAEDGSENEYSILFTKTDEDPNVIPTKDDVCCSYYSEGVFKFSSLRNDVSVMIFDTSGRRLYTSKIPISDPNSDDVCKSEIGAMFQTSGKRGQVYIYTFIYNKKKIVGASGKFLY